MDADIELNRAALSALCRRFDVTRLEVFGSAASGGGFDPARSDADFLVEFKADSRMSPLQQFFGLGQALENLLDRKVDLVEPGAVKNPFVLATINRSRQVIYAA